MKLEIETLQVTLFFNRYLPDNRASDQLMDDIIQAVEDAKPTDATKDSPTADVIQTDEGPLYKRDFSCTFGAPKPHGPMWKVRLKRIRDLFRLSIGSRITDWLTFWKWGPWILPSLSTYNRVKCEVTIQSNWLCAFVEQEGKCHPIERFDMCHLHEKFGEIEGFSGLDAFGSVHIDRPYYDGLRMAFEKACEAYTEEW